MEMKGGQRSVAGYRVAAHGVGGNQYLAQGHFSKVKSDRTVNPTNRFMMTMMMIRNVMQ